MLVVFPLALFGVAVGLVVAAAGFFRERGRTVREEMYDPDLDDRP
jgi:hypothetical protein